VPAELTEVQPRTLQGGQIVCCEVYLATVSQYCPHKLSSIKLTNYQHARFLCSHLPIVHRHYLLPFFFRPLALEPVSPQNRAKMMNVGHFRKKSIFNFCTTISSNHQEFRIKIDESESKMRVDRVGALSRSTRQPEKNLVNTTASPPSGKCISASFVPETTRNP